jgi:hypothetical protein
VFLQQHDIVAQNDDLFSVFVRRNGEDLQPARNWIEPDGRSLRFDVLGCRYRDGRSALAAWRDRGLCRRAVRCKPRGDGRGRRGLRGREPAERSLGSRHSHGEPGCCVMPPLFAKERVATRRARIRPRFLNSLFERPTFQSAQGAGSALPAAESRLLEPDRAVPVHTGRNPAGGPSVAAATQYSRMEKPSRRPGAAPEPPRGFPTAQPGPVCDNALRPRPQPDRSRAVRSESSPAFE